MKTSEKALGLIETKEKTLTEQLIEKHPVRLPPFKVVVDPRRDIRESENKIYSEQVWNITEYNKPLDGSLPEWDPLNDKHISSLIGEGVSLQEAFIAADWTLDPGTGRAVLLPDGRELLNPTPVAPPVGHDLEPSVNDLVENALRRYHEKLQAAADVEETLEQMLHFDEDPEFEPSSPWEVVEREMIDEAPPIPKPQAPVVAETPAPAAPSPAAPAAATSTS